MSINIEFDSSGNRLSGVLSLPEEVGYTGSVPCFIVLHGFGSTKDAGNVVKPSGWLREWGYATFRFDMHGCGESGGEPGYVIPQEQVEDVQAAVEALSERHEIDHSRIGIMGSSFGAAVAIYAAGVDRRLACVVSSGGWGNGQRKFRGQHRGEDWLTFQRLLEAGRRHRRNHGQDMVVGRYDIVPIPESLRGHVVEKSAQEFSVDVAQAMYKFSPEDVVRAIAPRPLLLLHSSNDSITPTEQSVALFELAGAPTDLHLFAETDHFMFDEENGRVGTILRQWLDVFFPSSPSGQDVQNG